MNQATGSKEVTAQGRSPQRDAVPKQTGFDVCCHHPVLHTKGLPQAGLFRIGIDLLSILKIYIPSTIEVGVRRDHCVRKYRDSTKRR